MLRKSLFSHLENWFLGMKRIGFPRRFEIVLTKLMGVERRIFLLLESLNARFSLIGNEPFFESGTFPWVRDLESRWTVIRHELDTVLDMLNELPNVGKLQGFSNAQDDVWKMFILYGYGHKNQASCDQCPQTAAAIERIPGMTTALFSILGPHKHIPCHRGPYNGFIRYHLGLKVPQSGACLIRVGSSYGRWEEGKSLIFDDSLNHEVWNATNEYRVVLFMDVNRPLPFPLSLVNRLAIKRVAYWPSIRHGRASYQMWEAQQAESGKPHQS